ncbi:MAG: RNA polymerase sigma factor [Acidimicrobiales bacterium]
MRDPVCDFPTLARRACDGDQAAKEALVECLKRLVWSTISVFGLNPEDRDDVFAATFCRFFEHLGSIRDPKRIPGWIATTARNEAYTLLRARGRVVITDEIEDSDDSGPGADYRILDRELYAALVAGFRLLPRQCQTLLRYLSAEPRLSYEEVGQLLDMPHGSIGPTRRRCLDRLRNTAPFRPFMEGGQP